MNYFIRFMKSKKKANHMNIGKQILALRRERNITREVLAAEMGVMVGAVSKRETGGSHS